MSSSSVSFIERDKLEKSFPSYARGKRLFSCPILNFSIVVCKKKKILSSCHLLNASIPASEVHCWFKIHLIVTNNAFNQYQDNQSWKNRCCLFLLVLWSFLFFTSDLFHLILRLSWWTHSLLCFPYGDSGSGEVQDTEGRGWQEVAMSCLIIPRAVILLVSPWCYSWGHSAEML